MISIFSCKELSEQCTTIVVNIVQPLHCHFTLHLGETDGSSYPNGGLRATHRAGGYLSVDPTSHIFLRGDTIFIPG